MRCEIHKNFHPVACHFILLTRSFKEQKFLIFREPSVSIFSCTDHSFTVPSKNSLSNPKSLQKIKHFNFDLSFILEYFLYEV